VARIGQAGILLGALGLVLAVVGLFPGLSGLPTLPGIGAVQLVTVLVGLSLLIFGAFLYVRFTFYARGKATLTQQIAMRLSLTALLFAAMSAVADILGFGSNVHALYAEDILFGPLQAAGLIGGFLVAAAGVLLYALAGRPAATDAQQRAPGEPG